MYHLFLPIGVTPTDDFIRHIGDPPNFIHSIEGCEGYPAGGEVNHKRGKRKLGSDWLHQPGSNLRDARLFLVSTKPSISWGKKVSWCNIVSEA